MVSKEIKSENNGKTKFAALVTYIIALICLIAGLFVPLFNDKSILALQLPDALNKVTGSIILTVGEDFSLAYPVTLLGNSALAPDIMAIAVVAYAVITLLGIFALIPIIASGRQTKTAYVFASLIEVLATLALSVYMIIALKLFTAEPSTMFSFNMVIALGGTVLMLIMQTFIYKGGKGAAKFFLFLLSVIGLLALYPLTTLIPQLSSQVTSLADSFNLATALAAKDGVTYTGLYFFDLLFADIGGVLNPLDITDKVLYISGLGAAAVVLLNLFSDTIELASNAKRAGHIYNIVRYALEAVFVICFIITAIVGKYSLGLTLVALAIVTVIQIVISAIRLVLYDKALDKQDDIADGKKSKKAEKNEAVEDVAYDSYAEEEPFAEPAVIYGAAAEPAHRAEPEVQPLSSLDEAASEEDLIPHMSEPAAEEPQTAEPEERQVYRANIYQGAKDIYQGDTDEFITGLKTNDLKIEFVRTFIERDKGDLHNIPYYKIGGDNKKFFSAIFIYLGRIRPLVSDDLMNHLYKELD